MARYIYDPSSLNSSPVQKCSTDSLFTRSSFCRVHHRNQVLVRQNQVLVRVKVGSVFLVSTLRNHRMVRMRHILFKHGGGKVSGEYLLIKRGRLELGNDQQRSINLFHWCVLEISQFYLCFLTLIDRHFYMPPLFFFGVYALSKLRSIVSYSMTLRRSSLVSVFFQNTPRDF